MNCPVCGLRCVVRLNSDTAECPDHGVLSALVALEVKGMSPLDAFIEIRAEQLQRQFRMFCERRDDVRAPPAIQPEVPLTEIEWTPKS